MGVVIRECYKRKGRERKGCLASTGKERNNVMTRDRKGRDSGALLVEEGREVKGKDERAKEYLCGHLVEKEK